MWIDYTSKIQGKVTGNISPFWTSICKLIPLIKLGMKKGEKIILNGTSPCTKEVNDYLGLQEESVYTL